MKSKTPPSSSSYGHRPRRRARLLTGSSDSALGIGRPCAVGGHPALAIGAKLTVPAHHLLTLPVRQAAASDPHEPPSGGGSAIGSALCSRLLGAARLCSPLLASDLGRWDKPQAGGVVVSTPLTSEGSQVRNLLRPPRSERCVSTLQAPEGPTGSAIGSAIRESTLSPGPERGQPRVQERDRRTWFGASCMIDLGPRGDCAL